MTRSLQPTLEFPMIILIVIIHNNVTSVTKFRDIISISCIWIRDPVFLRLDIQHMCCFKTHSMFYSFTPQILEKVTFDININNIREAQNHKTSGLLFVLKLSNCICKANCNLKILYQCRIFSKVRKVKILKWSWNKG